MGKARTLRGDRLHIGFFGKRNAGKSSLINAITGQEAAIVSDMPGTTTDPVFKAMELLPMGPVVLIDTAGLDDTDDKVGKMRKERSVKILKKTDLALLVVDSSGKNMEFEDTLTDLFNKERIPFITVLNKSDLPLSREVKEWLSERSFVRVSTKNKTGVNELKKRIQERAPVAWQAPFVRDIVRPGEIVVLVTPIDLGAPAGRLIMPQVKAIRDILDGDAVPVICKERELIHTLKSLKEDPALVITDSQVFPQVAADVPDHIKMTSFSILSARQKGDLLNLVKGVKRVSELKPDDKVLIAESCTHHPLEDDIGRIKIPRWLKAHVGGDLQIDTVPGFSFPDNLKEYKLVVHCGACTLNRKEMLKREEMAGDAGVPITNYGLIISFLKDVFPRALEPFPEIYSLFKEKTLIREDELKKTMASLINL